MTNIFQQLYIDDDDGDQPILNEPKGAIVVSGGRIKNNQPVSKPTQQPIKLVHPQLDNTSLSISPHEQISEKRKKFLKEKGYEEMQKIIKAESSNKQKKKHHAYIRKKSIEELKELQQVFFAIKQFIDYEGYPKKWNPYHDLVDRVLTTKMISTIISEIQASIDQLKQTTEPLITFKIDWHGYRQDKYSDFLTELSQQISQIQVKYSLNEIILLHITGKGDHSKFGPILKPQLEKWCKGQPKIKSYPNKEQKGDKYGSIFVHYLT